MRTNFVPKRRGELWSDWGLVSWPDDLLANFHIDSEECSPTDVESVADRPPPYWTPAVEHAETDRDVVIRCELPGVAPENLVVSLSPTRLIIAGEKRDDDYGRCTRPKK